MVTCTDVQTTLKVYIYIYHCLPRFFVNKQFHWINATINRQVITLVTEDLNM